MLLKYAMLCLIIEIVPKVQIKDRFCGIMVAITPYSLALLLTALTYYGAWSIQNIHDICTY